MFCLCIVDVYPLTGDDETSRMKSVRRGEQMNPLIEFCLSSLGNGGYEAMRILEEDPDLDIMEYGCLDHCDLCAETLYALVNGEVVTAETPDALVKAIYRYIEENPLF